MPAAIKQKLQASRRSQVVNGTDLERTFYIVLSNSIKERKKGENERKKQEKQKKSRRYSGTSRIFLPGD